jgi:hypothetical protein
LSAENICQPAATASASGAGGASATELWYVTYELSYAYDPPRIIESTLTHATAETYNPAARLYGNST